LLMCLAVSLPPLSVPAPGQAPSARVVEYGRYKVTVTTLKPAENVSGSMLVRWKDAKHLETTKTVPCKVGECWGLRLEYANLPKGRDYELRLETEHPEIKQPDGKVLARAVEKVTIKAGAKPPELILGWIFVKGFEHELVPGEWTRRVFLDGKEV